MRRPSRTYTPPHCSASPRATDSSHRAPPPPPYLHPTSTLPPPPAAPPPPPPPSLDTPAPPLPHPSYRLAPGSLSRKERASCRQLIINLVVSTDMAHHNALHDSLRALPPPCATEAADALATRRTCLLKCALHAADLHVPTLPWASSVGWVRALGNEFKSMVEQARLYTVCMHGYTCFCT
jgi:hypothetical protein